MPVAEISVQVREALDRLVAEQSMRPGEVERLRTYVREHPEEFIPLPPGGVVPLSAGSFALCMAQKAGKMGVPDALKACWKELFGDDEPVTKK